ncbi:phage tail protein [Deinococcus ruber]|uniref:Tail Collar domain-containing protein n=1 Tax=Deinococcus ruber TaxID=1848197 RepID=A0A918CQF3_9DEIO|nr:tail fiber protein [Deinococcus ruber]GGR33225.1 tail Collar domain-containing protein [Deinococcus ruber]
MADQFVAEIRIFPFNFAPTGWAMCNGQILPISQNTALFSLLGTFYGGNGTSNFALPNLQGNAAIGVGQGPGLSVYDLGQTGGEATVTLLQSEIPAHTHVLQGLTDPAESGNPTGKLLTRSTAGLVYGNTPTGAQLAPVSIGVQGGNQPHNNMPPYLTLNYCIALQGIYPSRG